MVLFWIVLILLGLGVIAFFSGSFESWIMTHCTQCGKKSKTQSISHYYESIGRHKPNKDKKPLGVIHNIHLCKDCYDEFFKIDPKNPFTVGFGRF